MKDYAGKWAFIAALALCFLLICFLSAKGPQADVVLDADTGLENDSLTLRVEEGGNVFIDGEGKLTAGDLSTLMKRQKIKNRQVNNLVLGDGITEVGYNCINGYTYMQTLKLGSGVEAVNNGAIKNCTGLEYVFLPKGIRRVGRDFLFGSDETFVVTDGEEADLPKLRNVDDAQLLTGVDSYEALEARRATTPRAVYESARLSNTDGEKTSDPMVLHYDILQYGPFTHVDAGEYRVRVEGSNFDGLLPENADVYVEGETLPVYDLTIADDAISYCIRFEQDTDKVEFRLYNSKPEDITLSRIVLFDLDFELPDALRLWW